jgi:hypothetical protein
MMPGTQNMPGGIPGMPDLSTLLPGGTPPGMPGTPGATPGATPGDPGMPTIPCTGPDANAFLQTFRSAAPPSDACEEAKKQGRDVCSEKVWEDAFDQLRQQDPLIPQCFKEEIVSIMKAKGEALCGCDKAGEFPLVPVLITVGCLLLIVIVIIVSQNKTPHHHHHPA